MKSLCLSWWGFVEFLRCVDEFFLPSLRTFSHYSFKPFFCPSFSFSLLLEPSVRFCGDRTCLFIELGRGWRSPRLKHQISSVLTSEVQFFKKINNTWIVACPRSISRVLKWLFLLILCLVERICQSFHSSIVSSPNL